MWRYQTVDKSEQELWQVNYAAKKDVGLSSPHRTPSAWDSANAAFKRESATARAHSSGGCWTQPCQNRWQRSSPVAAYQSGFSNGRQSASAPAFYSSQPAEAKYIQHTLLDAQWKSPSNHRAACHRHTSSQLLQPPQINPELSSALSFATAPGPKFSSRMLLSHELQDLNRLQRCQLGSSSAAVRCLSDLQQLSLNERSQMSGAFPLVCSSTVSSDQCSEAAALAASMWPNISVSQNTLADEVLQSYSSRGPLSVDLSPNGSSSAASVLDSSLESQGCKSEDDSAPELIPVEQPTMANPRKKKAKLDHITVEYLQKHHYFDMPLAEAAKSLDIGLSVMKRHCRDLGLARWPYRTRSSLRATIEKTERYLADTQHQARGGAVVSGQKAHVLEALQSHMKASTGQNGADLHDSIKRYRQSIFKLTYKLKKTKQNHKARHKILVLQNAAERVLAVQKQEV